MVLQKRTGFSELSVNVFPRRAVGGHLVGITGERIEPFVQRVNMLDEPPQAHRNQCAQRVEDRGTDIQRG